MPQIRSSPEPEKGDSRGKQNKARRDAILDKPDRVCDAAGFPMPTALEIAEGAAWKEARHWEKVAARFPENMDFTAIRDEASARATSLAFELHQQRRAPCVSRCAHCGTRLWGRTRWTGCGHCGKTGAVE